LANTYYWLDPTRRVTAVILTQILPSTDPLAGRTYGQFQGRVYKALASG
jgi:methyl acetate hydrolase